MEDGHGQRGKVTHPLEQIPLSCPLAGDETCIAIALLGQNNINLYAGFVRSKTASPHPTTSAKSSPCLAPKRFSGAFVAWVASLRGVPEGVLATDGQTPRQTRAKAGVRTDDAPPSFTTNQQMAANETWRALGQHSMRLRRKPTGWDDDFLESLAKGLIPFI